jgi:hypothetical protein
MANSVICAAHGTGLLVVAVVFLIVTKQRRVLSTSEVLFEAAFALRIDVALAAEQGQ